MVREPERLQFVGTLYFNVIIIRFSAFRAPERITDLEFQDLPFHTFPSYYSTLGWILPAGQFEGGPAKSDMDVELPHSICLVERVPRMHCPIMVQLIKKLDSVRTEQCETRGDVDEAAKKKRLRAIEAYLDLHERTCATCRQFNPLGTQFVENSSRR